MKLVGIKKDEKGMEKYLMCLNWMTVNDKILNKTKQNKRRKKEKGEKEKERRKKKNPK